MTSTPDPTPDLSRNAPSPDFAAANSTNPIQSMITETSPRGSAVKPQATEGVLCPHFPPASSPTRHPPVRNFNPVHIDTDFADPPETPDEPDCDWDLDYDESIRERELLIAESASYNEDFARSSEEGWFYSDGD